MSTDSLSNIPAIKSLAPAPASENDSHSVIYANALAASIADKDARNLALTGAYGVGKSTILNKFLKDRTDAVRISFSTLGSEEEASPQHAESDSIKTTNLIQKEIVKQLLYQETVEQAAGSRYRRRLPFKRKAGVRNAILIGLALSGTLFMANGQGPVRELVKLFFPKPEEAEVGVILISFVLIWAVASVLSFFGLKRLHNRFQIDSITTASATLSLSKNETYFDEYLDEIAYFFASSQKTLVVFEDIDRFNNSRIFETLRALNLLLNSINGLPTIKFIYAIKDSVFDSDKEPENGETNQGNRTKFFDYIIPVAPFITHLNSRDLMKKEMVDLLPAEELGPISVASRYIVDMRLIKQVRNEYLIFSQIVLEKGGLNLSRAHLFAMMLYKSIQLSDFEKIQTGVSKLDVLLEKKRELVAYHRAHLKTEATQLKDELAASATFTESSAQEYGLRLVRYVKAAGSHTNYGQPSRWTFRVSDSNESYDEDEVQSPSFWAEYVKQSSTISTNGGNGMTIVSSEEIGWFVSPTLLDEAWKVEERLKRQSELEEIEARIAFLERSTFASLLREPKFTIAFSEDGETEPLSFYKAAEKILNSKFSFDLIESGYITEDFTLYTSKYYGSYQSVAVADFLIHNVSKQKSDPLHLLSAEEVDSLFKDKTGEDLDGESLTDLLQNPAMYNISIVNRLLALNAYEKLDPIFDQLSRLKREDLEFFNSYLSHEKAEVQFVKALSGRWKGTLSLLTSSELSQVELSKKLRFFDSVLESVSPDTVMAVTDSVKRMLKQHYLELRSLKEAGVAQSPEAIAGLLKDSEIVVEDLSALDPAIRKAVVEKGAYAINRGNLRSFFNEDNPDISLDTLKRVNVNLYEKCLRHAEEYIASLISDEVSISAQEELVPVIRDLLEAGGRTAVLDVLQEAKKGLEVAQLSSIPPEAWSDVVMADRITPTFENVSLYLTKREVDFALTYFLSTRRQIVDISDFEQESRNQLAYSIINASSDLSVSIRMKLIQDLALSKTLDIGNVNEALVNGLLTSLLKKGVLPKDDPEVLLKHFDAMISQMDKNAMSELIRQFKEPYPTLVEEAQKGSHKIPLALTTFNKKLVDRLKQLGLIQDYDIAVDLIRVTRRKPIPMGRS